MGNGMHKMGKVLMKNNQCKATFFAFTTLVCTMLTPAAFGMLRKALQKRDNQILLLAAANGDVRTTRRLLAFGADKNTGVERDESIRLHPKRCFNIRFVCFQLFRKPLHVHNQFHGDIAVTQ